MLYGFYEKTVSSRVWNDVADWALLSNIYRESIKVLHLKNGSHYSGIKLKLWSILGERQACRLIW